MTIHDMFLQCDDQRGGPYQACDEVQGRVVGAEKNGEVFEVAGLYG